jgi:hypothetical protein
VSIRGTVHRVSVASFAGRSAGGKIHLLVPRLFLAIRAPDDGTGCAHHEGGILLPLSDDLFLHVYVFSHSLHVAQIVPSLLGRQRKITPVECRTVVCIGANH